MLNFSISQEKRKINLDKKESIIISQRNHPPKQNLI